jgi:SAM-dependent methyltransferase
MARRFSSLHDAGGIQYPEKSYLADQKSKTEGAPFSKAAVPAVGKVQFGDFLRLQPIGTNWGYDRGQPIDRLYIESFIQQHRADVQGRVLEAGDNSYTIRFGGARVTQSDIIHITPGAPGATIVGDLSAGDHIDSNLFDCIILTQTLHLIFNLQAAVRTLERILKPGGVLLMTVPGISQLDYGDWRHTWYWSMTVASLTRLLTERFSESRIEVGSRGNVLAATAFLHGLSQEDIPTIDDLLIDDPHYPLTILARAARPPDS